MEPILIPTTELEDEGIDEEVLVHEWRVEQLQRIGISRALSEVYAGLVDWHQIADLVANGCSPELALEIVR
jgi:hypothetical protein